MKMEGEQMIERLKKENRGREGDETELRDERRCSELAGSKTNLSRLISEVSGRSFI